MVAVVGFDAVSSCLELVSALMSVVLPALNSPTRGNTNSQLSASVRALIRQS